MDSLAKLLFAILFAFSMISCGRTEVSKRLSEIESYINWHPDSALVAVRQIDTLSLRTKAEKAKYSLLHAMALDKNYIDTVDTRIIMPAVDYYGRHGSPADRLKSLMYLGVEQYNAGLYNQAIVSFYQASEYAPKVEDQNLLGILYSRMADTYTMTRDYVQAEEYIDKSLVCFKKCGRRDQEIRQLIRQALNYTQSKHWEEAGNCYKELLRDSTIDKNLKSRVYIDYGMFLLSKTPSNEQEAFNSFRKARENGTVFYDISQICAYAYLLGYNGEKEEAEAIWDQIKTEKNDYPYHYWKHREWLNSNNYKNAYKDLWLALSALDDRVSESYSVSAANSQRSFLEMTVQNNNLKMQKQKWQIAFVSLICVLIALLSFSIFLMNVNTRRKAQIEQERLEMVIEGMRDQILEKDLLYSKNDIIKRKAKFAFLGEIYEKVYRESEKGKTVKELLSKELQSRIGDLRIDRKAQSQFENMIDREMNGLMTAFRKECSGLTEEEYKMASYYFAGFDNTTTMIIMDVSSSENMRTKKARLKKKIKELCDMNGNTKDYSEYF